MAVQVEHAARHRVVELAPGAQIVDTQLVTADDPVPLADADDRRAVIEAPVLALDRLEVGQHLQHPPACRDLGRGHALGVGGVEHRHLDLDCPAARTVGPVGAGHRQVVALADRLEPAVGELVGDRLAHLPHEEHQAHRKLKMILGASLFDRVAGGLGHQPVARAVDEVVGTQRLRSRGAGDDRLGQPAVALDHVDEAGMQEQLDPALQQHLLQDHRQDLVIQHARLAPAVGERLVGHDGVEPLQVAQDLVEHLALAGGLPAEVGDSADRHVAAGHAEAFDQHDRRAAACGGRRRAHPGDAAADDGHVRLVPHRNAAAPVHSFAAHRHIVGPYVSAKYDADGSASNSDRSIEYRRSIDSISSVEQFPRRIHTTFGG